MVQTTLIMITSMSSSLKSEESQAGEDQMDMTQFVAEEPQIPMRVQREVARLKRKVSEQEETIRALRAKLRRYEEAESTIRDEI